eukprot:CAMPEP_0178987764 /NCGR_PEP_ID=MMETSP0795-20121207/3448_1 /TAXON_ID=88552 /ORGANISM="Amoebophrya sp., Strain Ameob2" /LENGTH=511 /DNA_ID=CAMNT_0020678987 /DNA_START=115 /DNA_END=1650 /DNA_ORIENTATION=-
MRKQLVALTFLTARRVAPVAAAPLAQTSFLQEKTDGELHVEAGADGILVQTTSAFLARGSGDEDGKNDSDSSDLKLEVKTMGDTMIFSETYRTDVVVKDIAARCKKEFALSPFDGVTILRGGGVQPLQPDDVVEATEPVRKGRAQTVVLRCIALRNPLTKLIRVDADKLRGPENQRRPSQTWKARTNDFAQQLAKGATSLSDTYTDPFAKEFLEAAEMLFQYMAKPTQYMAKATTRADENEPLPETQAKATTRAAADENKPLPVRVATSLNSQVRQVENAAFSEWWDGALKALRYEQLITGVDRWSPRKAETFQRIEKTDKHFGAVRAQVMEMFKGSMKKMRELSRTYYGRTPEITSAAPHYRAYATDGVPDAFNGWLGEENLVSRAVHFAPTQVLEALALAPGQLKELPVPLEARVTLEFHYSDRPGSTSARRAGILSAIIVRGHTLEETDPDRRLGQDQEWGIAPFSNGRGATARRGLTNQPRVGFKNMDTWVEQNKASFPILGEVVDN